MLVRGQHLVNQRIVVVRLFDEIEGPVLQCLNGHRHVAVTGEKNHRQATIHGAQTIEHFDAAHSRHSHIQQHATAELVVGEGKKTFGGFPRL